MDTTVSVIGTVSVVTFGRWASDKQVDMKLTVGTGIYALIISVIANSNSKLAEQLALLVFVTAILLHIEQISSSLGFTKTHTALPQGRH